MDEHLIREDISGRMTKEFYIYNNNEGLLLGFKLPGETAQVPQELFNFLGGTNIETQGTYRSDYYIFFQTDLHLPILKRLTLHKMISHTTGIFGLTPGEFNSRINNDGLRKINYVTKLQTENEVDKISLVYELGKTIKLPQYIINILYKYEKEKNNN